MLMENELINGFLNSFIFICHCPVTLYHFTDILSNEKPCPDKTQNMMSWKEEGYNKVQGLLRLCPMK